MKGRVFGDRLSNFFRDSVTDFWVLPDTLRRNILAGRTARDRIKIIVDWVESEGLQFVSIDSAAKLLPPGSSVNDQSQISEVFNQIQRLPTVWILAHDRKPMPGVTAKAGNAEIVGSGRFAQDPDVIHQVIRPDGRSPSVEFHWGKVRNGDKPVGSIPLFFDAAEFRLFPLHPYLDLLQRRPMLRTELIVEAERRYGWKERRAADYVALLTQLVDANGQQCVTETMQGHNKVFKLTAEPVAVIRAASLVDAVG